MGHYIVIKKTKIGIILFFTLILLTSNILSILSVSVENSSNLTDIEIDYNICGAYPLGDEVPQSILPENTQGTPNHFDWRNTEYNGQTGNWLTPAKKQGQCGSCWAFAAIGAIEAMVNIQKNNPDIDLDLSEQQLVSCITNYCNGCHGGNSYYAWNYLMNNDGAILESSFPYEAVDFNGCDSWDNNDCSKDPVTCDMKFDGWDDFTVPIKDMGYYGSDVNDFQLIKYTVVNHGPVVTYMLVYSDFKYYQGGIYHRQSDELIAGHAVLIVGYDEEENYLICKNNAGEFWGENGFFRIPYGECMIGGEIYFVEIDEDMLNFPPNACAGGLYSTDVYESVSFSSQGSTDLDNNIESYFWDFGDGTNSADPNPIHTYNQKGIYPVTLTITDSLGKQDVDETSVFVDPWDVGNSWTYNMIISAIPDALYPPIRFPFDGEITELTLTVVEENNEEYVLDITGSFKGNFTFNFATKFVFNFILWGKIKNCNIEGSAVLNKKGFGLNKLDLKLNGFTNTIIIPLLPIPLWVPLTFDITISKEYNEPRLLFSAAPNIGKSMLLPSVNASTETTISIFFGIISKVFHSSEIIDETIYSFTNLEEITTPAGIFNSYKYSLNSSDSNSESDFFYATTIHNIVKFSGGNTDIFRYSGELISTNLQ